MNAAVVGIVFGVIFVSELPDKSMFASLVLGTRYRALHVWVGVAAAFLVHVVIAVAAGQALTLLPHRVVEAVVAVLFLAGAVILLFGLERAEAEEGVEEGAAAVARSRQGARTSSFRRVSLTSFGVIFLGEWGDITQIVTANYSARYDDPWSVGLGALLALWSVAALAVVVGSKVLQRVNAALVQRVTGLILLAFAALSAYEAITG